MNAPLAINHNIVLELPIPPSVNRAWFNIPNGGRANTREYNEWIQTAGFYVKQAKARPLEDTYYCVSVLLPFCMRGDIDNRIKPILDLLVKHKITADDRYVWSVSARRDLMLTKHLCRVLVSFHANTEDLEGFTKGHNPAPPTQEKSEPIKKDARVINKSEAFDFVIEACSKFFKIKPDQILGASRTRDISKARRIAMYCVKFVALPSLSYVSAGKYFKKDHSSYLHSCRIVEKAIADNDQETLDCIAFISSHFPKERPSKQLEHSGVGAAK